MGACLFKRRSLTKDFLFPLQLNGCRIVMEPRLKFLLVLMTAVGVSEASEIISGGKPTRQSSNFNGLYTSDNAVDGCASTWMSSRCCIHTAIGQTEAWWRVNLQDQYRINMVHIIYRAENTQPRSGGYQIYLSDVDGWPQPQNSLCYKDETETRAAMAVVQSNVCVGVGSYITIYTDRRTKAYEWYSNNAVLELCEVQVHGCPAGKYGNGNCESSCSATCASSVCNPVSGHCLSCKSGYYGDFCRCPVNCVTCDQQNGCEECSSGSYGTSCVPCSTGCHNNLCDQATGHCDSCNSGYYSSMCTLSCTSTTCKDNICVQGTGYCSDCDAIRYGLTCELCPGGCYNDVCNTTTGVCTQCKPGYYGSMCSVACKSSTCKDNKCFQESGDCADCDGGRYGLGCVPCPDGCYNNVCDKETGVCAQCSTGYYGSTCSLPCKSSNCKDNTCLKGTGDCADCDGGRYGVACVPCPGGCYNDVCDHRTGVCSQCKAGLYGNMCNQTCTYSTCKSNVCVQENGECPDCDAGRYGPGCVPCPDGCHNDVCDNPTGVCTQCNPDLHGCIYICDKQCPPNCHNNICVQQDGQCTQCIKGKYGTNCSLSCNETCSSCKQLDGSCTECIPRYHGSGCTRECGHCNTQACNMDSGSCPCEAGWEGETCQRQLKSTADDEGSAGVSAGVGIGSVIVIAAIIVLVVIFMRRRWASGKTQKSKQGSNEIFKDIETPVPGSYNPRKPAKDPPNDIPISADEGGMIYMNVNDDEVVYSNVVIRGVPVHELKSEIQRKKLNKAVEFQNEFKTYPWGAVHPHDNGKKSSNKAKNRFKTTFPYDHSRVILDTVGNDEDSTYINANYIDSTEESKVYIASQGPKPNTVDDFWRMVWKSNSGKIVMLTNLVESANVKCHKYWPDEGEPLVTKHFNLRLDREWKYAFYVIRDISVIQKKTKEERQIHQFHFTTWPDHDTPDTLELSLFHRRVRSYETRQTGQTVVHCSAGLGRTGTFIGLDALLEQEQKSGRVDIPTYVRIMRKDRMNMIQTYEQYIALHELLVEASELTTTLITRDKFRAAVDTLCSANQLKNQSKMRKEFEALQSLTPHYDSTFYQVGMMKENKGKSMSGIAADQFRAFLQTQLPDRTDYINAVVLQSHTSRCGYLVTQFPLADTIDDLWTMVLDYNCDSMVVLGNPTEDWLHKRDDASKGQDISIKKQQELNTLPDVDIAEYTVSCQSSSKEATVRIFTMKHWTSDSVQPPSTSSLLQLLELLDSRRRSDNTKPVVVMCLNGCTQSGLFCCIANARDQMKMDEEVDIFQVAREILKRSPQALATMEQYKYCYNLIGEYLDSHDVYIN